MQSIVIPCEDEKKPALQRHHHLDASHRSHTAGILARRNRFLSALLFGVCSFLIVSINKVVLTNWHFPSFQVLAVCQLLSTILLLLVLRTLKYVYFPLRVLQVSRQIMPLPLLHAGNLLFGLGGTQRVSLPMFIALRRLSIFLTMVGEMFLFNERPTAVIHVSVILMIGGALIAACNDTTFDVGGYTLVLCSAGFTAVSNIYTKQALRDQLAGAGGKYSILFYNALLVLPAASVLAYSNGEFERAYSYPYWWNFGFMLCFGLSCVMALALNYSTILCLNYNTALTTTVVGCLKNILTTYAGMMFLGGDYVFTYLNFIGINVSVVGSLIYSVIVYKQAAIVTVDTSHRVEPKAEHAQYKRVLSSSSDEEFRHAHQAIAVAVPPTTTTAAIIDEGGMNASSVRNHVHQV